ncbi:hypothetical protein HaLaN_25574 [Haematococcus lacustris]|uniref:Armadillo repeat-containing protein 8 n=1 Tax=Haematococcus lacustris TaxID=44745 RepID=A0A6A0A4I3_HAELA|nr:hypothetical protein HaLaN_25574 [Haematococcus lacustris]
MAGSAEEYDIDLQTVIKALNVLMNVSANDDLAVRIGQMPGCIDTLSRLQAHKHAPLAVLAARCLINLTHSNPAAASAADKAIIVLSAQLLSSLARESYTAQTLLAKAGAVGALMQLVEAHSGSCLEDDPSQATLKCKAA